MKKKYRPFEVRSASGAFGPLDTDLIDYRTVVSAHRTLAAATSAARKEYQEMRRRCGSAGEWDDYFAVFYTGRQAKEFPARRCSVCGRRIYVMVVPEEPVEWVGDVCKKCREEMDSYNPWKDLRE